MTRTFRKNSKYKKEARDGESWRGCGDKNCKWCAEDRQHVKISEKIKAQYERWDNSSLREDGRMEWVCKHGVGHTVGIPHQWVKLIAKGKMDSKTAFNHGCCQGNCCKGFWEFDDIESGDSQKQGGSIPSNSRPKRNKK